MESISRISSLLETARDLTLEAASSASAVRASSARGLSSGGSSARPIPPQALKKLLDSRNERDVLDGLRKVISLMYRSQPTLEYFSAVIKNIASPSLPVKKLVYIYLVAHAESAPDLALLSINTIQKSLSDTSPAVRALALRVMSAMRVPVISQIVSLAIKKGAADMSPVVRRTAALAAPKCRALDPAGTGPQLREVLAGLLGDRNTLVVGAAAMAVLDVCPDNTDILHKHYRALTRKLVDMDEWGQLATLRLLTGYARRCFPRRTAKVGKRGKGGKTGFYDDDEGSSAVEDGDEDSTTTTTEVDPDLDLLLKACRPLLHSRNAAVVVAVARAYLHLAPGERIDGSVVGPLVALLRGDADIQQLALRNIVAVCLAQPAAFMPYTTRFLVRATDPPEVWRPKLEVLTLVFPHCASAAAKGLILAELEHFSRARARPALVREAVRALGRCAQSCAGPDDTTTSQRCLRLLLRKVGGSPSSGVAPEGEDPAVVAEALTVIRHLIQADPSSHAPTVVRLAKNLDSTTDPHARASIIWLVGEFAGLVGSADDDIAPDVLRILVRGFADEAEAAKLQIVLLAAKVYVLHLNRTADIQQEKKDEERDAEHPIAMLWRYVLLLARYDTSYDLRDRARLYKALLSGPGAASTQLATLLLLAPKPVPRAPGPSEARRSFTLGSASLALADQGIGARGLQGYEDLPDWVAEGREPDPRLRDEAPAEQDRAGGRRRDVPAAERLDSAARAAAAGGATGTGGETTGKPNGVAANAREKTLDDWLAESEDDSEETESGEEEESGEDDSEDDNDEDEEDEDEDEDEEESDDEQEEHHRLVK
ncbi:MAG: AP-3 complex subunit beta [Thelocarpon impressellum]|nr:MAG: AP-3 complex subunit beta [Thelocarpon impressellum]